MDIRDKAFEQVQNLLLSLNGEVQASYDGIRWIRPAEDGPPHIFDIKVDMQYVGRLAPKAASDK